LLISMTSYLEYELHEGYIHNWVVAGPQAREVDGAEGANEHARNEHARKLEIAQEVYTPDCEVTEMPVAQRTFAVGDDTLTWDYVRCRDDHFVNCSTFYHTWHYLRAWAYSQVDVIDAAEVTAVLTTNGPADVWLNGEHVHRQEHFDHQLPRSVPFTLALQEGVNEILVRFEEVAARECPYVMALQIQDVDADDVIVRVPTVVERTARQLTMERAFEQAHVDELVDYRGAEIHLHWSDELDVRSYFAYQIQDQRERIHISGSGEAEPGLVMDIGHGFRLWERPYRVVLGARPEGYYEDALHYQRELPVYVLDTAYADEPYGSYEQRYREALEYAAGREGDLYAEIAKMELAQWDKVDADVVREAIARVNARGDCSDFEMVGLLGVLYRYGNHEAFPETLRAPLEACVLDFKYWHDEPGTDAMCYTTENHSILFHTCEILAGQLFPDEVFSNVGKSGTWHREKGERRALDWLRTRGRRGFQEWDSNCYFEEDLLALSHLAGLAEDELVSELAAVVMDKLFFTMAVNSYKGVFGSTHGRAYAPMLKSAQMEATSGICRLMFGMGVFNPHIRGMVGLACSEYPFPLMFAGIAAHLPDEMWDRERHVVSADGDEVNKVTYKTPDYMLSSAQDYHPGERGYQQHIWQATFGPDAVVFVNHPPCVSEKGAHRPNFWHGNVVLPRVAQWKDVLIALHRLPEDDWLGFTHAYFPACAFDAYELHEHWAFARKGEGYLALYAAQGLSFIRRGPSAYRELRSPGRRNVWLCQMGRAALDGSFEDFQERVMALDVAVDGGAVRFTSLRGDALAFDWQGALRVNGDPQEITGFKHYENPYCVAALPSESMAVQFGEYVLQLAF
jgi:hypothetical protein